MEKGQRTRLAILFGGRSGEHEVSLNSAASVISALDASEYDIAAVGITKSGKLASRAEIENMLPVSVLNKVKAFGILDGRSSSMLVGSQLPVEAKGDGLPPQIVFPLLHGPYGEDGTIQGLLEVADLPYIGCGVLASAVGMDKDVMKRLFMQAGLPVVPFRAICGSDLEKSLDGIRKALEHEFGYPMFSKPANLGSSVGICKIHNSKEFETAVHYSAQYDRKVVVEKGVDARELECAIVGNENPQASVVGEIIPGREFYDYDAKYLSPDSRLEIPAGLSDKKSGQIRDFAIRAFKTIDGAGLARVDFFMERETGKIWVNEINTMPGFTPISMYAKLWKASGIPFDELVRRLVRLGFENYGQRRQRKIS